MKVERDISGNRSDTMKMPVLFIGHGSPMNLILRNNFTRSLEKVGKNLPKPKAILVISAHWLTRGIHVTCMEKPEMIYDFYGFPRELYELKYACPGSPDDARYVTEIVQKTHVKCNYDWGLDHASWAVLRHMYPDADIPVFEMSLDYSFNEWNPKPLQYHYDIASELADLRNRGVLIIASGNIVHNLGLIDFQDIDAQPYEWAVEFDELVKSYLINKNHKELVNFKEMDKYASLAVPTLDHYLPMIYAIALQGKAETLKFTYEGFQNGSISMRCFQIG
ncbi:MAG: 4,5-DOPA dioxygenase extradiol [Candidatus Methanoperedens sp.]|nr:4,5-DOPA dioxygenase extradiol [Candidatus Methanoperedens sp.]